MQIYKQTNLINPTMHLSIIPEFITLKEIVHISHPKFCIGGVLLDLWDSWWRHQMETFSALLAICVGNSPVTGEFHAQRPVTRNFHVSLIGALNKRFSKQSWGWWFETPSRPWWRHCNVVSRYMYMYFPGDAGQRYPPPHGASPSAAAAVGVTLRTSNRNRQLGNRTGWAEIMIQHPERHKL